MASLWLKEPSDERLARVAEAAVALSDRVPEARRPDWDKLAARLPASDPKRKDRVEALVRACALFAAPLPPLPADAPVTAIPGFGATAQKALEEQGVRTLFDLVWTLPSSYDDLRTPVPVADAVAAAKAAQQAGVAPARVCVTGTVKSATLVPMRGKRFVNVVLGGEGTSLTASWFFVAHGVLSVARPGQPCLLLGRIRIDERGRARMAHPDLFRDDPESRRIRPRYARLGVPDATLRKAIASALERVRGPKDPVPPALAAREGMAPAATVLRDAHAPRELLDARAALERMAFAEAFTRAFQRLSAEGGPGDAPVLAAKKGVLARLRAELGFALTAGQERAIEAVSRDLAQPVPMRRLLLGDVGTGKTAVALAAAAQCVTAGHQVAILAPTGVLAEQYMDAVGPLARATGAKVALVVGGGPKPLRQVAEGTLDVVVGTHALLGEGVRFAKLGLVVVDEQHRLGVAQRAALVRKGGRPHLLTLSATPIPRSLALALRGELATSTLDERPAGRPPVETFVRPASELPDVLADLRLAASRGERAFVICPRIEAGEDDDDAPSAERSAEDLARELAPVKVALLHGGQDAEAQRRAMRAFRKGEVPVLVATTVVEVGVDVPEATRMVVLGAERFGLAQLHQLRGRVGRGDRPGRCVLLHGPLEPLAFERLEAVRTLSTGDAIARADLALRGAGDLGGTRQSGPEEELLFLDPANPPAWLARLPDDARAIHAADPRLGAEEHRGLALAIRRFARALAVRDEAG